MDIDIELDKYDVGTSLYIQQFISWVHSTVYGWSGWI